MLGGSVEIQRLDASLTLVSCPQLHLVLLGLQLAVGADVEPATPRRQVGQVDPIARRLCSDLPLILHRPLQLLAAHFLQWG